MYISRNPLKSSRNISRWLQKERLKSASAPLAVDKKSAIVHSWMGTKLGLKLVPKKMLLETVIVDGVDVDGVDVDGLDVDGLDVDGLDVDGVD